MQAKVGRCRYRAEKGNKARSMEAHMERYILSHDMGTSSDKAVLVDYCGNIRTTVVEPYPTYYPNPAWVEQDPA